MTALGKELFAIGLAGIKSQGMCSGESAALEAGEGDFIRCVRCRDFARESEMTPLDEGSFCPECAAMREDNPL